MVAENTIDMKFYCCSQPSICINRALDY